MTDMDASNDDKSTVATKATMKEYVFDTANPLTATDSDFDFGIPSELLIELGLEKEPSRLSVDAKPFVPRGKDKAVQCNLFPVAIVNEQDGNLPRKFLLLQVISDHYWLHILKPLHSQ